MPPLEFAFLQAPNAITKRYHPTLSQNANSNGGDASRVGKIKRKDTPLNNNCTIPDARRFALISACVSSSTKRYYQALPPDAITQR